MWKVWVFWGVFFSALLGNIFLGVYESTTRLIVVHRIAPIVSVSCQVGILLITKQEPLVGMSREKFITLPEFNSPVYYSKKNCSFVTTGSGELVEFSFYKKDAEYFKEFPLDVKEN